MYKESEFEPKFNWLFQPILPDYYQTNTYRKVYLDLISIEIVFSVAVAIMRNITHHIEHVARISRARYFVQYYL